MVDHVRDRNIRPFDILLQDVRVFGRLRRAYRGPRQGAPACDEPVPQVLPMAGHSSAQSPTHQAQRAVPHRFRVLTGVSHHQGTRHPAATQEGQPQRAEQDAWQDDHGSGQNRHPGRGHGTPAVVGQRSIA